MSLYIIRFSKGLMTGFLLFLNFLFLYSSRRQDNGIYNSFRGYYLLTAPPQALENIIYANGNYSIQFSSRTDMVRIQSLWEKWPIWARFRNNKKPVHSTTVCHLPCIIPSKAELLWLLLQCLLILTKPLLFWNLLTTSLAQPELTYDQPTIMWIILSEKEKNRGSIK